MKTRKYKFKRRALAATLLGLTLLSAGCGKSTPPPSNPAPAPGTPGAPLVPGVPPGMVPPGTNTGCIPISQPIPFQYNGAAVQYNQLLESPQYIKMGQLPNQQPFGQVIMAGGPTNGKIQRQNTDGSMINITMDLPAAPQQGPGNGAGYLQLSSIIQQDITNLAVSGQIPGLQGQNIQSLCVSGLAIDGGTYRNGQSLFFYGDVYLYLNGTMHGYVEKF